MQIAKSLDNDFEKVNLILFQPATVKVNLIFHGAIISPTSAPETTSYRSIVPMFL